MKPRRKLWIPVVTGLIHRSGKILLGQRPKGSLQGQWEFPGGKIEIGETPEEALKRELSEELGIDAEIGPLRLAATHTYGERGVLILFFDVVYWKGEPKSKHHVELKWVEYDDIRKHEIPEANRKMLDRLMAIIKSPSK
jgi:8-oxo-dGTP diphosphatase